MQSGKTIQRLIFALIVVFPAGCGKKIHTVFFRLLPWTIVLFSSMAVHAQYALRVIEINNGREHNLKSGKKIKYRLNNGTEALKGRVQNILDSALVVEDDTIALTELSMIAFNTRSDIRTLSYMVLGTFAISTITALALFSITIDLSRTVLLIVAIPVVFLMAVSVNLLPCATGALIYTYMHKRKFYPDADSKIEVVKLKNIHHAKP